MYREENFEEVSSLVAANINLLSGNCFFTCAEHRGYPLGKPFGPYANEQATSNAARRHRVRTGHTDITEFCGVSESTESLSFNTEERDDEEKSNADENKFSLLNTRCFCIAHCYKDSGDSSHFKKTVDVDCNVSIEEKRKQVASDLLQHYVSSHGLDLSNPEAAFKEIQANVEIRCYTASS